MSDWLEGATVEDIHNVLDNWDAVWDANLETWLVFGMTYNEPGPDLAHVCAECRPTRVSGVPHE